MDGAGCSTDVARLSRIALVVVLSLVLLLTGCKGKQQPERAPEQKKGGGEKQEDPIKSGASKMQSELEDLRGALQTGDTNEVSTQARELDDAWEGFEDKVEAKNPEMYDDVEGPLNNVLAGVALVPFDTNVISAEIDRLDKQLDELKETKGEPAKPKKVDMKTGASATRQRLSELKSAVDSGDTAKMQEKAKAVDRSWTQFEDEVREQSKEDHGAVEDSLHAILAGVKSSPVDKQKVKQQADKMDAKLAGMTK